MDSKKIQALLVAVDTGSFTKAADILGYTQSGLTHMMNSFEKEIGFQVLLRGHYGIKLTPQGEKILPYLQDFLKSENQLTDAINRLSNLSSNHIKIGAYSSIITNWLPGVIEEFQSAYPNATVEIVFEGADELYEDLYEGKIDVAFLSYRSGEQVQWFHLDNDELMAILPMTEKRYGEYFPIEDFNNQQFLMPYYGFVTDIMQAFNKYDVKPYIKSTFVDDASIITMVQHKFGISMLSRLVLKDKLNIVKALPLFPRCYRELGIACLPKDQPFIIRKFIDIAVKYINAIKKEA